MKKNVLEWNIVFMLFFYLSPIQILDWKIVLNKKVSANRVFAT